MCASISNDFELCSVSLDNAKGKKTKGLWNVFNIPKSLCKQSKTPKTNVHESYILHLNLKRKNNSISSFKLYSFYLNFVVIFSKFIKPEYKTNH